MKVLREGKLRNTNRLWWHGQWNCLGCFRQIEIEETDSLPMWHRVGDSRNEVRWDCPTCAALTTWRKNPFTEYEPEKPSFWDGMLGRSRKDQ